MEPNYIYSITWNIYNIYRIQNIYLHIYAFKLLKKSVKANLSKSHCKNLDVRMEGS